MNIYRVLKRVLFLYWSPHPWNLYLHITSTRELTIPKSIATKPTVTALTDKEMSNSHVEYFYTANCLLTLKSTYALLITAWYWCLLSSAQVMGSTGPYLLQLLRWRTKLFSSNSVCVCEWNMLYIVTLSLQCC